MKVTGFSFVRNAIIFDYPIIEAINSILPICDDFIIAVDNSDDTTLGLIKKINSPKVKIIETTRGHSFQEGGKVLADETDNVFLAVSSDSDWVFYIQDDEVVHEKYLETIYKEMLRWKDDEEIDGLLFDYKHIKQNYYRKEKKQVRAIKNIRKKYSFLESKGFFKSNKKKLNVKPVHACIYNTSRLKVYFELQANIKTKNWKFDYDLIEKKRPIKQRVKQFLDRKFGIYLENRNYKIIPEN